MKIDQTESLTESLKIYQAEYEKEYSKRVALEKQLVRSEDALFSFFQCSPIPTLVLGMSNYQLIKANYLASDHMVNGNLGGDDASCSLDVFPFLAPTDSHKLVQYIDQNDSLSHLFFDINHPHGNDYQASFSFSKTMFDMKSCAIVSWDRYPQTPANNR